MAEPRPPASGTSGARARPAAPGARRGARRGATDETRQKVLRATSGLLDRLEYRSVTLDSVARAAGVSRSTLYRHWPSREALVLEAYTLKTLGATAVPDTGDAVEDLRVHLGELAFCLDFGGAASTVAGLMVDAVSDPEFGALYRRTMLSQRRQIFRDILARGQRRGQVRPDLDVEVAIDALYGAVHHRLLASRQPIDGPFTKALVDAVARGIGQPGTLQPLRR